ncbi:MAG TPA: glycoside hydrolase family 16 protein [Candidatus Sulfotelmatobacter sp.]|nr:glycoside hydrolase family 16 protein [Candidatus Sulfotelmatobacter sp.]
MLVVRAIAAALIVAASAGVARGEGWRVVFEDRFTGTALDTKKWATRYIYDGESKDYLNDELERYRDNDNHEVAGNKLSLIARKLSNGKPGSAYESGMIRSRQTFYYGYFEAKVHLTNANGTWPAFWLNSDYDRDGGLRWPPEIDAFEYVINGTNETPDMIHSSVVVDKAGTQGGGWVYRDPAFNERWTYYRAAAPLNKDWVVVAVLWKPDSVTQYVNGKKIYTRSYKWVYSDGSEAAPAHILLNLAIGGHWAGANGVEDAKFPQQLQVQYVRVCQFTPAADGTATCGGSEFTPPLAEARYTAPYDDLPRTKLIDAVVAPGLVARGTTAQVRYTFTTENTERPQEVCTTLVDDRGKDVFTFSAPPAAATTGWKGSASVKQTLTLPERLGPGRYRVLVSVGSRKPGSDLLAPQRQNIPLVAVEKFGTRDARLRYQVGEIQIQ